MTRFYRFYHYLARFLFLTLARRCIVRGVHHVPRSGPAILISNHISYSDPASIIGTVPRQVYFMTKSEMFNGGFMDWVITKAEAFPVRRDSVDREALRHALAVLERGDLLGIYPEGTRSHDHNVQQGRAGVVMLARQSGAPIVPVAITGMERVFKRRFPWLGWPVITITFGPPFTLDQLGFGPVTRENRAMVADAVMERLAALLPPEYQGVYAPIAPARV